MHGLKKQVRKRTGSFQSYILFPLPLVSSCTINSGMLKKTMYSLKLSLVFPAN
jgi:hypothetical protein